MLKRLTDKSILFIEDDKEVAKHSIVLFQEFVENVYHASSTAEADTVLQSHTVDIIISDIKLKTENGLDFIYRIRQENPFVPIIIISGHKDEAFLFRSITLGLTAYLLKPIAYDDLIDAFERCSDKIAQNQQDLVKMKDGWQYSQELKTLQKNNELFILNKKEILFIELLIQNKDRIITKSMIQTSVWESEEMSDAAISNFILRIRKRFGKTFIYTVPDIGYRYTL